MLGLVRGPRGHSAGTLQRGQETDLPEDGSPACAEHEREHGSHSEGLSPPDSPLWAKKGSGPLLPGWGARAGMRGLQVLQQQRREAARGTSPPDMPSARERGVYVTCDADNGLLETFLSSYLIVTPNMVGQQVGQVPGEAEVMCPDSQR